MLLSSMSSRLMEIRTRIQRYDKKDWHNLRTREIDPLLEHVDRIFKITSRRIALNELEWQQVRGQ